MELSVTADEACGVIGISPATLYAYVSRGLVRAGSDPADGRRSLYDRQDVAKLASRKRRPRGRRDVARSTLDWGEPALASSITRFENGSLSFRGHDAIELSRTTRFEEICELLCGAAPCGSSPARQVPTGRDGIERMLSAFTDMTTSSVDDQDKGIAHFLRIAIDAACGLPAVGGEPVECQLARALLAPKEAEDSLRRALVLCADHELNPSSYAARIAASAGASRSAAIVAALATFSGTRHGRLPSRCRSWIELCLDGQSGFWSKTAPPPGFGHRLYPDGDPRSRELMRACPIPKELENLAAEVLSEIGLHPNVDFALASVEIAYSLPEGSAVTLFATSRVCGWLAHTIEQQTLGQAIRPRAYEAITTPS